MNINDDGDRVDPNDVSTLILPSNGSSSTASLLRSERGVALIPSPRPTLSLVAEMAVTAVGCPAIMFALPSAMRDSGPAAVLLTMSAILFASAMSSALLLRAYFAVATPPYDSRGTASSFLCTVYGRPSGIVMFTLYVVFAVVVTTDTMHGAARVLDGVIGLGAAAPALVTGAVACLAAASGRVQTVMDLVSLACVVVYVAAHFRAVAQTGIANIPTPSPYLTPDAVTRTIAAAAAVWFVQWIPLVTLEHTPSPKRPLRAVYLSCSTTSALIAAAVAARYLRGPDVATPDAFFVPCVVSRAAAFVRAVVVNVPPASPSAALWQRVLLAVSVACVAGSVAVLLPQESDYPRAVSTGLGGLMCFVCPASMYLRTHTDNARGSIFVRVGAYAVVAVGLGIVYVAVRVVV